jgi:antibiotic biosynthesis monooxygenase (ABM) superfamily enzyme
MIGLFRNKMKGELEMAKARFLNLVGTECVSGDEVNFNKWYNEVHIPMLLKYKGLKKVTRYKLAGDAGGQAPYLAVYEYDNKEALDGMGKSPEFKAAIDEMTETQKKLKFGIKWAAPYEPLKTWGK